MVYEAGLGHIGGEFSAIDILTTLYFGVLRIDPARPDDPDRGPLRPEQGPLRGGALRDARGGRLLRPSTSWRPSMAPLSRLNGHPDRTKVPGRGDQHRAAGARPAGRGRHRARRPSSTALDRRTFVLTGDGELQEGSNWEAAMAAGHFGLDNLIADRRPQRLQQGDRPSETMRLEPLADKWRAFGWACGRWTATTTRRSWRSSAPSRRARAPEPASSPTPTRARASRSSETRSAWHHHVPTADQSTQLARAELRGAA